MTIGWIHSDIGLLDYGSVFQNPSCEDRRGRVLGEDGGIGGIVHERSSISQHMTRQDENWSCRAS
jgi:hypothetical protein